MKIAYPLNVEALITKEGNQFPESVEWMDQWHPVQHIHQIEKSNPLGWHVVNNLKYTVTIDGRIKFIYLDDSVKRWFCWIDPKKEGLPKSEYKLYLPG